MKQSISTRVVLATGNRGKAKEIRAILDFPRVEFVQMTELTNAPSIRENGRTFRENAVTKAKTLSRWSGLPAIADDSGLEVDCLGGRPGVRSARYAGEAAGDQENNAKLLLEVEEAAGERTARFVCVACYADAEGHLILTHGVLGGRIALKPAGNQGFGYDPLFIPDRFSKTLAELGSDVKNEISHRAIAFRELKSRLGVLLGPA